MSRITVGTNTYYAKDIMSINCNNHNCTLDGYFSVDPVTRKWSRTQTTYTNDTKEYYDLKRQFDYELTERYVYKYNPYFGFDTMVKVF